LSPFTFWTPTLPNARCCRDVFPPGLFSHGFDSVTYLAPLPVLFPPFFSSSSPPLFPQHLLFELPPPGQLPTGPMSFSNDNFKGASDAILESLLGLPLPSMTRRAEPGRFSFYLSFLHLRMPPAQFQRPPLECVLFLDLLQFCLILSFTDPPPFFS